MKTMDILLRIWFSLTAASFLYVAYDLFAKTPAMKVMKWGWLLVVLYTGPVAAIIYALSCREPAPGTHETFVAPLWKQAVGSTIHCLAGDATGIIVSASITLVLGLPMGFDSIVEYVSGFAFGLFIFQALFMKGMLGGSYAQAVKKTWLAEWLSMNAVMSGMIPTMVILMAKHMRSMDPASGRFWGVMSLATLVGAVLAYPVNWWLVKNGLKHGMGTERVLGRGGERIKPMAPSMPMDRTGPQKTPSQGVEMQGAPAMTHEPPQVSRKILCLVALITLTMLGLGVMLADRFGDFHMRPDREQSMTMSQRGAVNESDGLRSSTSTFVEHKVLRSLL